MTYRVLATKVFVSDLQKISKREQNQIKKKISALKKNPTRYKRLHYDLKGSSRLRAGKLRVIFSYDEKKREVYLEKIVLKHRY